MKPGGALVVANDPTFFIRRSLLALLAASHRVPVIAYEREFAVSGGLLDYGTKSDRPW